MASAAAAMFAEKCVDLLQDGKVRAALHILSLALHRDYARLPKLLEVMGNRARCDLQSLRQLANICGDGLFIPGASRPAMIAQPEENGQAVRVAEHLEHLGGFHQRENCFTVRHTSNSKCFWRPASRDNSMFLEVSFQPR